MIPARPRRLSRAPAGPTRGNCGSADQNSASAGCGAELPGSFSPHPLRHTFASLLLPQGESPVYVQRQLGHASIKLTVDTYGRWLPMGNKAAVDRLDEESGSRRDSRGRLPFWNYAIFRGEPWRIRTSDSLLKRQELYLAELTAHGYLTTASRGGRADAGVNDPPRTAQIDR